MRARRKPEHEVTRVFDRPMSKRTARPPSRVKMRSRRKLRTNTFTGEVRCVTDFATFFTCRLTNWHWSVLSHLVGVGGARNLSLKYFKIPHKWSHVANYRVHVGDAENVFSASAGQCVCFSAARVLWISTYFGKYILFYICLFRRWTVTCIRILMVKTGQFTTQCKYDNVICLKRQISFLLVDWQNR